MKKVLIGLAVVAVLGVGVALYAIGVYTSVRNGGNTRENALSAKWNSIQADYGQWRLGVTDSLGIAREKRDAMDQILTHAIEGRYNKAGAPQVDSGKLFSAISEAYPDLSGTGIYDKVMAYVKEGREKFSQNQQALQKQIEEYNTWRTTGSFLHPLIAGWMFPSNNLKARVGNDTLYGESALEKMSKVIVGGDTTQIFETGTDQGVVTPEKKK